MKTDQSVLTLLLKCVCVTLTSSFFYSCTKPPAADFTVDKPEYNSGETIRCTNKSADAEHFNWVFMETQRSADKDPEFVIPANTPDGNYDLRLQALSKNKNKSSDAVIVVVVRGAPNYKMGTLLVWGKGFAVGRKIMVDGMPAGTITKSYDSVPVCGADGCVSVDLLHGTHQIYYSDGHAGEIVYVLVKAGSCSAIEMY